MLRATPELVRAGQIFERDRRSWVVFRAGGKTRAILILGNAAGAALLVLVEAVVISLVDAAPDTVVRVPSHLPLNSVAGRE